MRWGKGLALSVYGYLEWFKNEAKATQTKSDNKDKSAYILVTILLPPFSTDYIFSSLQGPPCLIDGIGK